MTFYDQLQTMHIPFEHSWKI